MPHDHARAGDTSAILEDYLSHKQLARELGVAERTLDRWRAVGEGPPRTLIGQRVYYAREDVRTWLREQRREVA